jgi:hypothetical protein
MILAACFVGCGDSGNTNDMGGADLSASAADLTSGGDMTKIVPFNMPGSIYCYSGPLCSTSSANKVCCDSKTDGGFSDACVPTAAQCLAMDSMAKTFECGQAADCASGQICCGDITTSSSGKKGFKSTSCATSCTSTQTQLCVTAAECKASGVSCVGADITGRDVGLCQ